MTLTMATQDQLNSIRTMVDENIPPEEISNYFGRIADLNSSGILIVRNIAIEMTNGVDVQPDGVDLADRYSLT